MKKRRSSFSETVDSLHTKMTKQLKKNTKEMNDYLLENGHVLFSYYNEKKSETNSGGGYSQSNTILDFFNTNKEEDTEQEDDTKTRY